LVFSALLRSGEQKTPDFYTILTKNGVTEWLFLGRKTAKKVSVFSSRWQLFQRKIVFVTAK